MTIKEEHVNEVIDIHPDFRKMPAMRSITHPLWVASLNAALQFAAMFKWHKFRRIAKKHIVRSVDGGTFPVWVIKPENLSEPAPVLVYFHGSGFMIKHVPQHIENAVHYAREASCCVLFADYRLAPKCRFPIPFEDCYATLSWAIQNAEALGLDKDRIVIGGDSAGGALAASVVQKAVHEDGIKLRGQMLVYPITDHRCITYSSTAFAKVPPFKAFSMPEVWKVYLGESAAANPPPYASPMQGNLRGLPPAYVETEQYDPWRDEGTVYAKALEASGGDVELNEIRGSVHGFDAYAPTSEAARVAFARRIRFLKLKLCHVVFHS